MMAMTLLSLTNCMGSAGTVLNALSLYHQSGRQIGRYRVSGMDTVLADVDDDPSGCDTISDSSPMTGPAFCSTKPVVPLLTPARLPIGTKKSRCHFLKRRVIRC